MYCSCNLGIYGYIVVESLGDEDIALDMDVSCVVLLADVAIDICVFHCCSVAVERMVKENTHRFVTPLTPTFYLYLRLLGLCRPMGRF